MANNAANVMVGKPNSRGGIWVAPLTATVPTDATTALGADFKCLGFASEDGLTNSMSYESEEVKAWGGDTVLSMQTGFTDTFSVRLIEALNEDVIKTIYNSANVSGSLSSQTEGLSIKANNAIRDSYIWVYELTLGNRLKRIVIPSAKITELGEIAYRDNEPVGYDITLTAVPDASGDCHHEYISPEQ